MAATLASSPPDGQTGDYPKPLVAWVIVAAFFIAYIFVVNIIGLALGPTAAALVGDTFFPKGDGIRYALAIVCSLAYLLAVILFLWSVRSVRETWARIQAEEALR